MDSEYSVPVRGITFAPNVDAETYGAPPPPLEDPPAATIFPAAHDADAAAPRRASHARKKPDGWVPRPPNAFILFRSEFIKSQHVPGDVEANHGNLSKIIGLCWRNLPFPERSVWEHKARLAQAAHKAAYPHYRFRPHTKPADAGPRRRVKEPPAPPDARRVAHIAGLLVDGVKGARLARAVRQLDAAREAVEMRFDEPVTAAQYKGAGAGAPKKRRRAKAAAAAPPSPQPAVQKAAAPVWAPHAQPPWQGVWRPDEWSPADEPAWARAEDAAWSPADDAGPWSPAEDTGPWSPAEDTGTWSPAEDTGTWSADETRTWSPADDTGTWSPAPYTPAAPLYTPADPAAFAYAAPAPDAAALFPPALDTTLSATPADTPQRSPALAPAFYPAPAELFAACTAFDPLGGEYARCFDF